MKTAAVVAHFDPANRLDASFKTLLSCLEQTVDTILLVTTSNIDSAEVEQFEKVSIIQRPNFGYDFYSYRVGVSLLRSDHEISNIFLINSSFIVLNAETLKLSIRNMLLQDHDVGIVGLTHSEQFSYHVQSYLLLLRSHVFRADWFIHFFDNVQPLNTKLEIILAYEIGLSTTAIANGASVKTVFRPNAKQKIRAHWRWMRVIAKQNGRWGWLTGKPIKHRNEVNWTHFCAEEIATQFGIVKTELLRTNPHSINTDFISKKCNPASLRHIETFLDNSRQHYKSDSTGLTTLFAKPSSLPAGRILHYGKPGTPGIKVAVVVHLFYFDLLDEICGYLRNIVEPFDLFVTTPFEGDIARIINRAHSSAHSVTIWLTENRGRDIGPFVSLYRSGLLDCYSAVLKLHSKKSKYSSQGSEWRKQIYGELAGNSLSVQKTISLLESGKIGLIGPHSFYLSHQSFWGANKEAVKRLLTSVHVLSDNQEPELGFFAGSMFWFYPKALEAIKKIPLSELALEPENGIQDGTLAHAIERIFCQIVTAAGYKVTSLQLSGSDFSGTETHNNRVPVL